jgi:hypothetical protein
MDAIVVEGLEKTYGKDVRALDGMRFWVPVEWAVRAARGQALATVGAALVVLYLLLLLAFTALTGSFATWAFRVYQRTL